MKTILALVLAAELLAPRLLAQKDTTWQPPPPKIHRQHDVISQQEILEINDAKDAYEVVRRLRPHFLVVRNTGSAGRTRQNDILVWVNGAERGPLETLRTIPAHAILEIRKISAADATTQYGQYQNGVILVRVATGYP